MLIFFTVSLQCLCFEHGGGGSTTGLRAPDAVKSQPCLGVLVVVRVFLEV